MIYSASMRATEEAWSRDFRGNAHLVLIETIADLLNKMRSPYARLTSIVNSSGTGKSRMVDQLGMQIITVPMCLRPKESQGFPPPDDDLRDWLVSASKNASGSQRLVHGFTYSLLTVTRIALETIMAQEKDVVSPLPDLGNLDIQKMPENEREEHVSSTKKRQVWLAQTFHKQMTLGQSLMTSNGYRKDFYKKVILLAKEFMEYCRIVSPSPCPALYVSGAWKGVAEAGEMLCRFVDPYHLLDSAKGPRWPLVVFSFDEAHILTDIPPREEWNLFLELRCTLRQIHKLPIFSLFLSGGGRFFPELRSVLLDPSPRVRHLGCRHLDPITEISFDDIAYPTTEGAITLDRVVQVDWMSHLGRPLFGSRWDAMEYRNETALMDFAKEKLLGGPTDLAKADRFGSLACLSVRFALEFNADELARDVARALVEHYMRLCLVMTTGLGNLVTLAGSEPLLAEAAFELFQRSEVNAVRHLAHHSVLNCIDHGRRGEVVAVLIIMHACDKARMATSDNRRWISVVSFMEALLPPSEYEILRESRPTFSRPREDKPFEETFQDYAMWFNHVINIRDSKMISVNNLWKFVTRGAMILCSDDQDGIDIVLPLCDTKRKLSRDSVTAILIQVRNSQHFEKNMKTTLFDTMSPFDLGMFPKDGPSSTVFPKPVIRLVLALASSEAGVVFREGAVPGSHPDTFTAFDIWLAGLSTATFRHIGEDLASYHILLDRSMRSHGEFELSDDPLMGQETKKLKASRRRRLAPLVSSRPGHGAIHGGDD